MLLASNWMIYYHGTQASDEIILPICAFFVKRVLLQPRLPTERGESQLKGDLYKTREMLIPAHLNGFNPTWKQGSWMLPTTLSL